MNSTNIKLIQFSDNKQNDKLFTASWWLINKQVILDSKKK